MKKRVKNILKISGLIGIRQGYFLVRNWYLLMTEPYLTIKSIKDTRDKSQIFLIAVTALAPVWIYMAARVGWDLIKYGRLVWLTGSVFLATGLVQAAILVYLGFFTLQVLRKDR